MKRTVSFSKQTKNIFFHILTKCNLSCSHCYINPKQHGSNTLSLSIIEKWLGLLCAGGEPANLIFLGGEPTLHPALPQAVKTARRLGAASITIDTNGYLFHDILEKVTPEDVDFFSFSLDGPAAESNDRLRGKGSFETCIAGIRKAKQKGFNTSLIYTVSRMNLAGLEAMVSLLTSLPIDRFFIQVIGLRGRSAAKDARQGKDQPLQVSCDDWRCVVPPVAEKIAARGIPVSYPKVFLAPEESFECAGLVAENYFIFPNGRVYQCPLCEDFPLHSRIFQGEKLMETAPINEADLFQLKIPEGCVMNRIIQPENIQYDTDGKPFYQIACCMLKEEISFS
jgi:MoaA/NifB/PqqE/SkfB family radical SAM enzyme